MGVPNMEPKLVAVSNETGEPADMSVLEDAGIAFDPTNAPLDLNKDEKRRTTALMLAIQAYDKLIIKDAEYYIAVCREQDRNPEGPKIRPATINAMVGAAIQFDYFISGKFEVPQGDPPTPAIPPAEQPDGRAEKKAKKAPDSSTKDSLESA